jgi:hypothetical protein
MIDGINLIGQAGAFDHDVLGPIRIIPKIGIFGQGI